MSKMLVIRGLPGSSKTTLASSLNESLQGIILSTDSVLCDSNGTYLFSPDYMGLAHALNQAKCKEVCRRGLNVIIDNTNTITKEVQPYYDIAMEFGYDFEMVLPSTSWAWDVEECFKRNTHGVPLETIQRMKQRFESNEKVLSKLKQKKVVEPVIPYSYTDGLPSCVIVDMDGTTAIIGNRSPYDPTNCHLIDNPNIPVVDIINKYYITHKIIILTGREYKHYNSTQLFLTNNSINYHELYMRDDNDKRKDCIVKKELFYKYIHKKYNVLFWLDDRNQIVDMVRKELKLPCFQVNYGNF